MATNLTRSDLKTCRAILRKGSRSFSLASWLLPARVRAPATALYAFCRVADDAIDLGERPQQAAALLRQRVTAMAKGQPHAHAVDRALCEVMHAHAIPAELLHAMIEGFEWDNSGRTYAGLDDLHAYAARVGATVGVMMCLLMGVRDPERLARACDLGVAMQLTNIARDVGEDARAGRLYLPESWFALHGLDVDEWRQHPTPSAGVGAIVHRLLAQADRLYTRADAGIAVLPRDCQSAILGARRLYAAIGQVIAARNYDSVSDRAYVRTGGKLRLAISAMISRPTPSPALHLEPLPECRFLIEAVTDMDRE